MNRPNEAIRALWGMPAHDFDQWRREHDLPDLLTFFKEVLPHFGEWQSAYGITDAIFLAPTEPSQFFLGEQRLYLSSSTGPDYELHRDTTTVSFHERPLDPRADDAWQLKHFGNIRYRRNWELPFTPFFAWLRHTKHVKAFPIPGDTNAFVSDFDYRRIEAADTIFSRASLFHSHNVLKLGGVAIPAAVLDDRNLDFVDLDHLVVSGRGGSRQTNIAYSSCRGLTFRNYNKPFVSFTKCSLENPRFENCHLEGFEFVDSAMSRPTFRNARLFRFTFTRSIMGQATFENCDLIDVSVSAPRRASAEALGDFYKRLRVAFQSIGNRREASYFYYRERVQQLRGYACPIIPRVAGLPGLAYADSLLSLYDLWKRGQMPAKRALSLLRKNMWRIFTIATYPPYLWRFARVKIRIVPELFDWLVWGFGERPIRVFGWMALVLGVFTIRYYAGGNEHVKGNWVASLSCSAYNFATIGCEYRGPFDSAEGILGAILLGIMVAGFSNRTRY